MLTRFLAVAAASLYFASGCARPDRASPHADAADAGFLARAQQHIAEREYRASENDEGL